MKKMLLILLVIPSILFTTKTANSQSWQQLMDSSKFYQDKQNIETALVWSQKALTQADKEYGKNDTNYAKTLNKIAELFYYSGELDSAIYYQEQHLKLCRTLFKGDHPDLAGSINSMANIYDGRGRYAEAEPLYKEALEMFRRMFKGDHPDLAGSINSMANIYDGRGRYAEAEPLYQEALEMYRRLFKGDNPDLANSINSTAGFYLQIGRYAEAEPLFKEALEMRRRLFKGDHPDLANSINNMAAFYDGRGRYAEAEPLFKEALEMIRRIFKGDHPNLAMCINNMAGFYASRGRYAEAEPLFKEALDMYRRLFKGDHPDLAYSINSMANFYGERGRYVEAEPLFEEAFEMFRRMFKGDHPDLAYSIRGMAYFYNETGRYTEAEPLYKEALEMYRRLFKGDHPDLAGSINSMANFYNGRGRYAEAEPLFKLALEMYRCLFKGDHPELANSINSMAYFYNGRGKFAEAAPLFKEALEMRRRLFKGDHPGLATSINNMAYFYNARSRYAEAAPLYKEALEMRRRLFKGDHPDLAGSINNMATFYGEKGRYAEAEPLYKEALQIYYKVLSNYFPSLSEKEKMQFWNTMSRNFEGFNTFALKRIKENPAIVNEAYDNQLMTKGLLISSSMKVKNNILKSGNKELIRKFEDWQFEKDKITKYYKMSQQQLKQKNINLDSVIAASNDKEKELSKSAEGFTSAFQKRQIKCDDVKNELRKGEGAIELVRFRLYEKRWTDTVYYAALIIKKNSKNVEMVLFKNGNELEDKYIRNYKKSIENKIKDKESYSQYWEPVAKKLKGIKKVYISPDGVYNQLNLLTLMNPKTEKYVTDEIEIQVVGSTRDLTERKIGGGSRENNEQPKVAEMFGNPQFNVDSSQYNLIASRYADNRERSYYYIGNTLDSTTRHGIVPIPGTKVEIDNISSILTTSKWKVNSHLGSDAVEEAVKSLRNPTILHIATHGLFLKDMETKEDNILGMETQRVRENPLLRSMLLLTGAENTLKNERNQNLKNDDGLLTAYEAMNLNLDMTELVVLSACETGLGEIRNGEGVYGLQRAFQQAGAKALIMSLWKVNDLTTQELMTSFYTNWLAGMTKREAFNAAQRELKKKYPEPYYWGAFVMVGE